MKVYLVYSPEGLPLACYYYKIRPFHRVLGIWYWCKRTISAKIDLNYDLLLINGDRRRYNYYEVINDEMSSIIEKSDLISLDITRGVLITCSESWFKTPDFPEKQYINFHGNHSH